MSQLFSMLLWNTCLAGGLALIVYFAQRSRWLKCHPSLWHLLWLLVLVKLVVPPVFTVPVVLQPTSQSIRPSEETSTPTTLAGEIDSSWPELNRRESANRVVVIHGSRGSCVRLLHSHADRSWSRSRP